jgi:hypothetical protein
MRLVASFSRGIAADPERVTRVREGLAFHGPFYGLKDFCCKTAQLCVTRRKCSITESPSAAKL